MSDVATRLELVVSRLEALANTLSAGGAGAAAGGVPAPPGAAPAAASSGSSKPFVSAYQEFLDNEVAAFVAAASAIEGVAKLDIPAMASKLYNGIGLVMRMAGDCKKPDQKVIMEKIKPVVDLFPIVEKLAFKRSKFSNYITAFKEMLPMANFLFVPKPRAYAEESYTLPDTYLNKILIAAKKQEGEEQAKNRAFVSTAKAAGKALAGYIKKYHAAAISWNSKGGDAKSWSDGGGAPAGGAPPPPPAGGMPPPPPMAAPGGGPAAPPPMTSAAPGGMAAVFAQISAGSDQCESAEAGGATAAFKLKRVTKEMKKAMKKLPPKEQKKKPKKKAAKKKVEKKKKIVRPPKCEYRQGTWWVENQVENKTVEGVEIKHSVYIYNAGAVDIRVPGKIKSITVDGCKRTRIFFDQVISVFDVINCDGCKVFIEKSAPSVQIDKSRGTHLFISAAAAENPPNIVTSNISETNVSLPGTNPEKDDPIEIPLPEQYLTTITGKNGDWKTDTEMVTHGD